MILRCEVFFFYIKHTVIAQADVEWKFSTEVFFTLNYTKREVLFYLKSVNCLVKNTACGLMKRYFQKEIILILIILAITDIS